MLNNNKTTYTKYKKRLYLNTYKVLYKYIINNIIKEFLNIKLKDKYIKNLISLNNVKFIFNFQIENLLNDSSFYKLKLASIKNSLLVLNPYSRINSEITLGKELNYERELITNFIYKNPAKMNDTSHIKKDRNYFKKYSNYIEDNLPTDFIFFNIVKPFLSFKFEKFTNFKKILLYEFNFEKPNNYYINNNKFFEKNVFKNKIFNNTIYDIWFKKNYFIKNRGIKEKNFHMIPFTQLKMQIRHTRFYYRYFLKYSDKELTLLFKNINKTKIKNTMHLSYLINNILYFIPSLKVLNLIERIFIYVNKRSIRSKLFQLFKGDLIEIFLSKYLLLMYFNNFFLKIKFYSTMNRKSWINFFLKKTPYTPFNWKNYNISVIKKLDKYSSIVGFNRFISLNKNIEFCFLTCTFFILDAKDHDFLPIKVFDRLFSGHISKYKFLNWKYIN